MKSDNFNGVGMLWMENKTLEYPGVLGGGGGLKVGRHARLSSVDIDCSSQMTSRHLKVNLAK